MRAIHYRTPADSWRLLPEQTRLQAAEDYVLHSLRTDSARSEMISGTGERRVIDDVYCPFYLLDVSETIARSEPGRALLNELASVGRDGLYSILRSYEGFPAGTPFHMPFDADDTALHTYGLAGEQTLRRVAERILDNVNSDGLIELYFTDERPRVDSVVCASALYLIYLVGYQDAQAARLTEDFLYALLANDGYTQGSLYTPSPDFFLYTLFRVARRSPGFRARFEDLLTARLTQRIGTTTEPAGLALRVIMCRTLHIPNDIDYDRLLAQQNPDGSWDPAPIRLFPSVGGVGYNRALDTTFAAQAVRLTLELHEGSRAGL